MKYFGKVIKYFRKELDLSRVELSKGICSAQYIYLVERGKRIPSIEVSDKIAAKLNLDWKKYVEYCDNPSPVKAKKLSEKFIALDKKNEMEAFVELFNNLPDEPWTRFYPTNVEILAQKICVGIRGYNSAILNYDKSLKEFIEYNEKLLNNHDISFLTLADLRSINVYARWLLKEEETDKAVSLLEQLLQVLERKKSIFEYNCLYVSAYMYFIECLDKTGNHETILKHGTQLIKTQGFCCFLEQLPLILIQIGKAYNSLSDVNKAKKVFKRAVAVSKLTNNSLLTETAHKHLELIS